MICPMDFAMYSWEYILCCCWMGCFTDSWYAVISFSLPLKMIWFCFVVTMRLIYWYNSLCYVIINLNLTVYKVSTLLLFFLTSQFTSLCCKIISKYSYCYFLILLLVVKWSTQYLITVLEYSEFDCINLYQCVLWFHMFAN